ncbi:MAG: PLP-dependent aminotransferase family protein, partial [Rhodospirillaceae bacterium]
DDYDSEFRYAGRPIPAMASVDAADRTLYVGSFTKVFSTSLRLGFVVIPPKLIGHFRTVLRQHGSRASLVPQRPLAVFMQDGLFYRHIRKVRRIYGERRRHLLGLIQRHLSDLVDVTDHGAGMHLVLHLPEGREDSALAAQLHQAGVACQPLSPHYGGAVKRSGLLVGFCGFTPEEMDPAIAVLARVVSDV